MRVVSKSDVVALGSHSFRRLFLFIAPLALSIWPLAAAAQVVLKELPDPRPLVQLDYPNVLEELKAFTREPLYVVMANNTNTGVIVELEARSISGGDDQTERLKVFSLRPAEKMTFTLPVDFLRVSDKATGFASQFLLTGRILDAAGKLLAKTRAPSLFYHRDERGVLYVYRTLINNGIVGRVARPLPKSLLETLSQTKSGAIAAGKPGPPPADANLPPIRSRTYEAQRYEGGQIVYGWWVQICPLLKVNYEDSGFGEDYWTTNSDKLVAGVHAIVLDDNWDVVFDDFTADGYSNNDFPTSTEAVGCTPWLFATNRNNWVVVVKSRARVRGNDIEVFDNPTTENLTLWAAVVDVNGGPNFISMPFEKRESSVLAAAAQAILTNNGAIVTGNYKIHTGVDNIVSFHNKGNHKIYMTEAGSRQKFAIVHEMGHSMLFEKLGDDFGQTDASHNAAAPCDSPIPDTHTMASKEFSLTAFHEGFANFYGVVTWNSTYGNNAVFVSWGEIYDPDPGPGNIWMRYHCASPYNGFGNETDWMRFFWSFHKGGVSPVDPVPFNEIVGIIAFASPLPTTGAYQGLAAVVPIYNQGAWSYEFFYWADLKGITY